MKQKKGSYSYVKASEEQSGYQATAPGKKRMPPRVPKMPKVKKK
jgi:hypothetical protein